MKTKAGLDLPDDFAAGAAGIEDLIEKAPEGAPEAVNAGAAVGALVGLGQPPGRAELAEELFAVEQALLAERLAAPTAGGEPGLESGEAGGA